MACLGDITVISKPNAECQMWPLELIVRELFVVLATGLFRGTVNVILACYKNITILLNFISPI